MEDAGFYGNWEADMVVFHFLNGDSDGAVATKDFTKNMDGSTYVDLMEQFYGGGVPGEVDMSDVAVKGRVRNVMERSRNRGARQDPATLRKCNATVPMNY